MVVLFLVLIAFGQAWTPSPAPADTPPATVTADPMTTMTATDTALGSPRADSSSPALARGLTNPFLRFSRWLGTIYEFLYSWFIGLLKLLATLLALYVIVTLFQLLAGRQRQLIIETFTNASSADTLTPLLPGLTILAREQLTTRMGRVQRALTMYGKQLGLETSTIGAVLKQAPLPASISDDRLQKLVESIAELAPEEVKSALPLLNQVLPQPATHITVTLHQRGALPGAVGITFELVDTERCRPAVLRTWWEVRTEQKTAGSLLGGSLPVDPLGSASAPGHTPSLTTSPKASSGGSALGRNSRQADDYYHIGQCLYQATCYADAVQYFQKALQVDHACAHAAEKLSESTARFQRQQGGQAAYTIGARLQSAGLVEQAIASYTQSLLPADQVNGASRWRMILTTSGADAAAAYLVLARLYRKPGVWLHEEACALLKLAVMEGSDAATLELEQIQREAAEHLTHAGERLVDLAQYDAAETVLMRALDKVPEHTAATATLALVKQHRPEEDDETRAVCAVAAIYEAHGALQEAREQYAEAMKKKPESDIARQGYTRLLRASRTLDQRYNDVVKQAMYWVAAELLRQELLAHTPSDRLETLFSQSRLVTRRLKYQAQVHNFFGALYLAEAPNFGAYRLQYLDLSAKAFEQAKAAWPDLYEIHENLGDTLSMLAAWSPDPKAKKRHLKTALESYERAAKVWQASGIQLDPAQLSPDTIGRRLVLGSATTRLRMRDNNLRADAFNAILQLENNTPPRPPAPPQPRSRDTRAILKVFQRSKTPPSSVPHPSPSPAPRWMPEGEQNVRLLYNLSVWFAIAAQLSQDELDKLAQQPGGGTLEQSELIRRARRYLACALSRDAERQYRYQAETDSDLDSIRTPQDRVPAIDASSDPMNRLKDLFDEIDALCKSQPDFPTLAANPFTEEIEKILRTIKWA